MDDLDPVVISQRMLRMPAAGDDLAVHFDRDPALGQTLGIKQGSDGGTRVERAGFTVQEHADRIGHIDIFACFATPAACSGATCCRYAFVKPSAPFAVVLSAYTPEESP